MLNLTKFGLLMFLTISFVYSEDEMNLHVEIVDPENYQSEVNGQFENNNGVSSDYHELPVGQKSEDLCAKIKCDIGERCVISDNEAFCECIESCEIPKDERQKVCSSSNQTFESDCHFLRQKCWCNKNDAKCNNPDILNDKLDYYGACRYIESCSEEQKKVFPGRMKIWLDEVLHILNDRKDLDPKFFNLVKLADEMKANHVEKYWTAGVAFEFCELDKSKDHSIQKDELRVLVSSIKALENCIQPFLDECDTNNNDMISESEWGQCLDLSTSDMEILKKYCYIN